MKYMMCRWAYSQEILIHFFPGSYAPLELRNSAKMKYTTETFCYHNLSETV